MHLKLIYLTVGQTHQGRPQDARKRNRVMRILYYAQEVDKIENLLRGVEILLAFHDVRDAIPLKRLNVRLELGKRPQKQGNVPVLQLPHLTPVFGVFDGLVIHMVCDPSRNPFGLRLPCIGGLEPFSFLIRD